MTLGRSSSGAIKIKTDGGLRAVECACCQPQCAETGDGPCASEYDATEAEYLAWRRGGTLVYSISWSVNCNNGGSVADSGTIIVPPNSCLVVGASWDIKQSQFPPYPSDYISFLYGFLKKSGGGFAFSFSAVAGVNGDAWIQTMIPRQNFGECMCATPSGGPFLTPQYVEGRPFCPGFDTCSNPPAPIVANITFTPSPP